MYSIGRGSPRNHSLRPGSFPRLNSLLNDGRRRSPSTSKILGCCFLAKMVARFADTVLFPSSGIVLVINNFFRGRLCCSCRKRTPRKRNFSAARLSCAVRQTSLLSGGKETGND